jgi:hypothetical protein
VESTSPGDKGYPMPFTTADLNNALTRSGTASQLSNVEYKGGLTWRGQCSKTGKCRKCLTTPNTEHHSNNCVVWIQADTRDVFNDQQQAEAESDTLAGKQVLYWVIRIECMHANCARTRVLTGVIVSLSEHKNVFVLFHPSDTFNERFDNLVLKHWDTVAVWPMSKYQQRMQLERDNNLSVHSHDDVLSAPYFGQLNLLMKDYGFTNTTFCAEQCIRRIVDDKKTWFIGCSSLAQCTVPCLDTSKAHIVHDHACLRLTEHPFRDGERIFNVIRVRYEIHSSDCTQLANTDIGLLMLLPNNDVARTKDTVYTLGIQAYAANLRFGSENHRGGASGAGVSGAGDGGGGGDSDGGSDCGSDDDGGSDGPIDSGGSDGPIDSGGGDSDNDGGGGNDPDDSYNDSSSSNDDDTTMPVALDRKQCKLFNIPFHKHWYLNERDARNVSAHSTNLNSMFVVYVMDPQCITTCVYGLFENAEDGLSILECGGVTETRINQVVLKGSKRKAFTVFKLQTKSGSAESNAVAEQFDEVCGWNSLQVNMFEDVRYVGRKQVAHIAKNTNTHSYVFAKLFVYSPFCFFFQASVARARCPYHSCNPSGV